MIDDNLDPAGKLSPREIECLALRRKHMSAKSIAAELQIGVQTVEDHLKSARRKLSVRTSMEAAEIYENARLAPLPPKNGQQHPQEREIAEDTVETAPIGRVVTDLTIRHRVGWIIGLLLGILALFGAGILVTQLMSGAVQAPRQPSQITSGEPAGR